MKRITWLMVFVIGSFGLIIVLYSGLLSKYNIKKILGQQQCRDKLTIAAGLKDGDSNLFANTMKNLVQTDSKSMICIHVLETPGTRENIDELNSNKAQLATAQADVLFMKDLPPLNPVNGSKIPESSKIALNSAQAVLWLFSDMYQLVVKNDSGINNVSDLRDKRIALPPKLGGQIRSFAFLMNHYGLITKNQQSVKLVEVSPDEEGVRQAFCNKEVHAAFFVRTIRNDNIGKLLKCDGRLVSIDQADALKNKIPSLQQLVIHKGNYVGGANPIPDEDVNTVGVPRLLLARNDVPQDVIDKIIQILDNHRPELSTEIPAAFEMKAPKDLGLTIHSGAQEFFNLEPSSWFKKNSELIQIVLGTIGILITVSSIIWVEFKRREQQRKNKADDYMREVSALIDAKACIKALVKYVNAQESEFYNIIVETTAIILLKREEAELEYRKRMISNDSLTSFKKTLQRVVRAIAKIDESEKIFDDIIGLVTKKLVEQYSRNALNRILLLLKVTSENDFIEKQKITLRRHINDAKSPAATQEIQPDLRARAIKSTIQEIQQDLNAILARATRALDNSRISQDAFQAFLVVLQIAVGKTD